MRLAFIIFRLIGYAAVLSTIVATQHSPAAWLWVAASSAWGVYDHLKRPDDSARRLRLGVWLEAGMIVISTFWFHQPAFLCLLLSPAARACVHLPFSASLPLGTVAIGLVWLGAENLHAGAWVPWAQSGSIIAVGSYSIVMGLLLRQRDRLRRTLSVSVFEQEQRARDEERLRIATQLHDVMGQYWTAVIRALDVAEATGGEVRMTFLHKARDAAVTGLAEMRQSIQSWNQGRQSADEWMAFLEHSLHRLRDITGISMAYVQDEIHWRQLQRPELTAEAIARIVVESITNAIRHGHAEHVNVHISSDDLTITVLVADDGVGWQSTDDRSAGTGLRSMEQLACSVNGSLVLQRTKAETRVELSIPYLVEHVEVSS